MCKRFGPSFRTVPRGCEDDDSDKRRNRNFLEQSNENERFYQLASITCVMHPSP
jgi:hypothetical protein